MEIKEIKRLAENYKDDTGKPDEIIPLHEVPDAGQIKTFSTGFDGLDKLFDGGFTEGEVVIISGIAKMGKTQFSIQISKNYSDRKMSVLWFSYEMPLRDIKKRFEKLGETEELLLFVPRKNISDEVKWLEEKIMTSYHKWLTKIVFIDNLDFITAERKEGDDKLTVQKRIVAMLKRIAIDNDLIIFLNAHVHKIEEGKEPRMQNIYGASEIFKLADAVVFIHREREKVARGEQSLKFTNRSKIIVDANRREGQNGAFWLKFENGKFIEEYV